MSWSKQARFDAVEVVSDVRHGEFQRTSSVLIGIGSVITAAEIFFERSDCGDTLGTGWTYGPPACAAVTDGLLAPVVVGSDAMSVTGPWMAMRRAARNATTSG